MSAGQNKEMGGPAQSRPLGTGESFDAPFQVVTKSIGNYSDNIRKKWATSPQSRPLVKGGTERCVLFMC